MLRGLIATLNEERKGSLEFFVNTRFIKITKIDKLHHNPGRKGNVKSFAITESSNNEPVRQCFNVRKKMIGGTRQHAIRSWETETRRWKPARLWLRERYHGKLVREASLDDYHAYLAFSETPFPFMRLPRELRDMIRSNIVGPVIWPHFANHRSPYRSETCVRYVDDHIIRDTGTDQWDDSSIPDLISTLDEDAIPEPDPVGARENGDPMSGFHVVSDNQTAAEEAKIQDDYVPNEGRESKFMRPLITWPISIRIDASHTYKERPGNVPACRWNIVRSRDCGHVYSSCGLTKEQVNHVRLLSHVNREFNISIHEAVWRHSTKMFKSLWTMSHLIPQLRKEPLKSLGFDILRHISLDFTNRDYFKLLNFESQPHAPFVPYLSNCFDALTDIPELTRLNLNFTLYGCPWDDNPFITYSGYGISLASDLCYKMLVDWIFTLLYERLASATVSRRKFLLITFSGHVKNSIRRKWEPIWADFSRGIQHDFATDAARIKSIPSEEL